jgi:hypothetical protein
VITRTMVIVGLALTLLLPIYPEGISLDIAAFFGLAVMGAAAGLAHRAARRELLVVSPWLLALLIGMLVGSFHNSETLQAVEDSLPYILFVLGLLGGRGSTRPRGVLVVTLWVCAIDSLVSLWMVPEFGPGIRSTYTYWKITAGLPLVGMYASSLLRHTDPRGRPAALRNNPLHLVLYTVMFIAMVASVSRGMILGWVLAIVVTAYIRKPSQVLAGGIAIALAFVVYSSVFADLGARYLRADQSGTIGVRVHELDTAWRTFVDNPLFGAGLGSTFEIDGTLKSYVHNMAAYHLWKFGLVGSAMLTLPLWVISTQLRANSRELRAIAIGGGLSVLAYLVTCAAYKNYYLVWIYGVVSGATLSWLATWRQRSSPAPEAPEPDSAPGLRAV